MEHIPVLKDEVVHMGLPAGNSYEYLLDATFGRGGHTEAFWQVKPSLKVCALDQDMAAIDHAKTVFADKIEQQLLQVFHDNFVNVDKIGFGHKFDIILVDLGVSSPQLDKAERGFSFYHDGPLDMRMDQTRELKASDIVNFWESQELSDLFYQLGEVKFPNKVVRAIVDRRKEKQFETTHELSELIAKVDGWRSKGQHPATKYFLAIRLAVNKELEVTQAVIPKLIELLNPKGRLLVISFHSLEDRIIKNSFKEHKHLGTILTKKVIQAQWPEKKKNPRARSAKLRVFERGESNESRES